MHRIKILTNLLASLSMFVLFFSLATQVKAAGCNIDATLTNVTDNSLTYSVLVRLETNNSGNLYVRVGSVSPGAYGLNNSNSASININVSKFNVGQGDSWTAELLGSNISCSTPFNSSDLNLKPCAPDVNTAVCPASFIDGSEACWKSGVRYCCSDGAIPQMYNGVTSCLVPKDSCEGLTNRCLIDPFSGAIECRDSNGDDQYCCPNNLPFIETTNRVSKCVSVEEHYKDIDGESSPSLDTGSLDDIDISSGGPTNSVFNALNPLYMFSEGDAKDQLLAGGSVKPANIIQRAIIFLFPLAGIILFVMIVWGGFEILSQAATKKSMDAGRQRITAAIIGFFLLFASYWIMQIVEAVFGINIL